MEQGQFVVDIFNKLSSVGWGYGPLFHGHCPRSLEELRNLEVRTSKLFQLVKGHFGKGGVATLAEVQQKRNSVMFVELTKFLTPESVVCINLCFAMICFCDILIIPLTK